MATGCSRGLASVPGMGLGLKWRARAAVQDALESLTGYRLVRQRGADEFRRGLARPPRHPQIERLVPEPVFLLSSVRSGSTLLRAVLDSHSEIHSPHETHFRRLQVTPTTPATLKALDASELRIVDAEHLLWDRLLDRSLRLAGKRVLVEKTPSNVFAVDRLAAAWPGARFIFLLRHPLAIARSWHAADPHGRPMTRAVPHTLAFMEHLERARQRHAGITVRYEELTADAEAVTRRLCDFLGVDWEASMLDYGRADHGDWQAGIGDWSDRIRSGRIQQPRALPTPAEIPDALVPIATAWGYLPGVVVADANPLSRASASG